MPTAKTISVSLFLCLCKSASMMSKQTPMLRSVDPKNVDKLVARGLMVVRDDETVPTMDGFRMVKGLAPVPLVLVRQDNAVAAAPALKAMYLKAAGTKAEPFADTPYRWHTRDERKVIRTLGDLRNAARAYPKVLAAITDDLATDLHVYG